MMAITIFSIVVLLLYAGLSWFSLRDKIPRSYAVKSFYSSSAITVLILVSGIAMDRFWSLFIAVLIVVLALYIESARVESNGKLIKNGMFGGLWISIPIYVYLATNT